MKKITSANHNPYHHLFLILMSVLVILIVAASHTRIGSSHDGSRMAMIQNIIQKNSYWTDGSIFFNSIDMVMDRGHFYSDKPPLLALYSAALLYPFKNWIHFTQNPSASYYLITVTSTGISLLFLVYLMIFLFRKLSFKDNIRFHIIAAFLLGTSALPFALTYSSHITEALLCFVSFFGFVYIHQIRQKRCGIIFLTGLCLGISTVIHPFMGCVFFTTGCLCLLFQNKIKYLIVLIFAFAIIICMGLGLNRIMFQTWKPYYFDPVKYLYLIKTNNKIYFSGFLLEPKLRGLNKEMIATRTKELGLPINLQKRTLERFEREIKLKKNYLQFMSYKWMRWDFYTFNPLILTSLFTCLLALKDPKFKFKLEILWIFFSVFLAYTLTIYFGSLPGASYGDRYLIPLLPMILVGAGFCFNSDRELKLFVLLYAIMYGSILPSTSRPWHTNESVYAAFNNYFNFILTVIIAFLWFFRKKFDSLIKHIFTFFQINIFCITLWILWVSFQTYLYLYKSTLNQLCDALPRIIYFSIFIPCVIITIHKKLSRPIAPKTGLR